MPLKQILGFLERYYISLMTLMATLVLFLNFHGQGMSGILRNYRGFKQIILAGFDPAAAPEATPTFPMWGYGWVFLLTENKLVLLVAQNILAIFSVWFCFSLIEKNKYLPSRATTLAKILMIAAVPWYAFHSLLWPYSIANSLLIISLCLFVKAVSAESRSTAPFLISGLLFGLALNFRSDYYLFPIGFILIIGLITNLNKLFLQKSALWMTVIYLTLIPWGLYTKSVTGHYLLTSTNAGAALYIGLGSFPGNKWGITLKDGDPKMHQTIKSHFGESKSFVSYEVDQFLKSEFFKLISDDPSHFTKKVIHNLRTTIIGGTYQGEFYESPDCYPNCYTDYSKKFNSLYSNLGNYFNWDTRSLFTIPAFVLSGKLSMALTLLSYLALPFTLSYAFKKRNLLLIAFFCPIAYQTLINMAGAYLPSYTSNIFFFLLINLCLGIYLLVRFFVPQTQPHLNKCAE